MDDTKHKIRQAFNKASNCYNQYNAVQNKAAEHLRSIFEEYKLKNYNVVLDLGCGNGKALEIFLKDIRYDTCIGIDFAEKSLLQIQDNTTYPICADIEQIPIKSETVSMVFSNMSLQWLTNTDQFFAEMHRVLSCRGWGFFSIPIKGSFHIINEYCPGMFNQLFSKKTIKNILKEQGFHILKSEIKNYTLQFLDIIQALKSIRNIGAGVRVDNTHTILTKKIVKNINRNFNNRCVPLNYKILFLIIIKGKVSV